MLGLLAGEQFKARLTHLDGTKLGKLDIKSETEANSAASYFSCQSCRSISRDKARAP